MAIDNKDKKVLKSSIEREQNELACSAEREKIKGSKNLNVPHLRFPEFTKEWEMASLQDIAAVNPKSNPLQNSFVYIDLEAVEKGELRKIQEVMREEAPSRAQRVIYKNDILFQCVRPYQKNNYIHKIQSKSNQQWVASTGYAQIRTTEIPNYIYHLLNTDGFNRKVMVRCTGSSYPAINSEDLATIRFYLTTDTKEQLKISRLLDLLDERIATQNKIIEDLKLLKSAIIDYIFNNEVLSFRKRMHLSDVATKITQKNTNNHVSNVLSNSANQGIIPQSEVFDREIANEDNTSNYFVISQNDFVYNPRKSATAPYGPINRYNGRTDGVISPLYLCFRSHNIDVEYLGWYFKSDSWYKYVYQNGDTGVRHDRVSIKDEIFFSMPLFIHNADEQIEIAKRLNKIESFVKQEEQYLFLLESQKLYLLQQMFI